MTRIARVKNAAIKSAVQVATPLTDAEYDKLEKLLKTTDDFSLPLVWDDMSDVFIIKLPDSRPPTMYTGKDNKPFWSVPAIMTDNQWTSWITTDPEEAAMFEAHAGCMVAVVGKLVEKKGEEKTFYNINAVRGTMIVEDGAATVAKAKSKPRSRRAADDDDDL